MIKIEVKSETTQTRQINGKNGPLTFHEQEAWAYTFDQQGEQHPYPQRIVVNIERERGQEPYKAGVYVLAPESIFVNRFGSLQLGRAKLRPLQTNVKAAA